MRENYSDVVCVYRCDSFLHDDDILLVAYLRARCLLEDQKAEVKGLTIESRCVQLLCPLCECHVHIVKARRVNESEARNRVVSSELQSASDRLVTRLKGCTQPIEES